MYALGQGVRTRTPLYLLRAQDSQQPRVLPAHKPGEHLVQHHRETVLQRKTTECFPFLL